MENPQNESMRRLLTEKFGITCNTVVRLDFRSYRALADKMWAYDELEPQLGNVDWLIHHTYITKDCCYIAQ